MHKLRDDKDYSQFSQMQFPVVRCTVKTAYNTGSSKLTHEVNGRLKPPDDARPNAYCKSSLLFGNIILNDQVFKPPFLAVNPQSNFFIHRVPLYSDYALHDLFQ